MYATDRKIKEAIDCGFPLVGQIAAIRRIQKRMEFARNEDSAFKSMMWTLGHAKPPAQGESERQERVMIAAELVGNFALTACGAVLGYLHWGIFGSFVGAYALGALGHFAGGQIAHGLFNWSANKRLQPAIDDYWKKSREDTDEDAQSGRREDRPPAPHTTGHAGPRPAVPVG